MGRKAQISLFSIVMLAIVGALLVFWWDSTHKNVIAEGVTIGGVDVGGLEPDEAGSQVRTNLIAPLDKKVKVTYDGEDFKLTPKEIGVEADVEGMVDQALAASQEGGVLGRTWRGISGEEVSTAIQPKIKYSQDQVDKFLAHVSDKLGSEPVDASVTPGAGGLEPVSAESGQKVKEKKLRRQVEGALQDPASRTVKALVEKVKPEVTTSELADKYPTYMVVDRSDFTLTLYNNLKLAKTYTVAIGAEGFDTPAGQYSIQNKQVDPVWSVPDSDWAGDLAGQTIPAGPENPLKARWMGIFDGAGIHGTSDEGSLGSAASHGCVRMAITDVVDLYDRVDVGTPIYIG